MQNVEARELIESRRGSETSLANLFFTFARLVSVKVENQFLRLVSQG